jgi:hypothetical protein
MHTLHTPPPWYCTIPLLGPPRSIGYRHRFPRNCFYYCFLYTLLRYYNHYLLHTVTTAVSTAVPTAASPTAFCTAILRLEPLLTCSAQVPASVITDRRPEEHDHAVGYPRHDAHELLVPGGQPLGARRLDRCILPGAARFLWRSRLTFFVSRFR